jgi:uncharacterized protein YbjQ (UPF0145 family)
MKKGKVFVLGMLAMVSALVLAGCFTTGTATAEGTNSGNFGEHIRTPVKDFETVGLVFTETQLTAGGDGTTEGQMFTYQALLKEAQALGADSIINVTIDKKIQVSGFPASRITTWYGSALAIKYTTTLAETGSVTVTTDGATTTTVTTSVYFNDAGAKPANTITAEPSAGVQTPAPSPTPARGVRQ